MVGQYPKVKGSWTHFLRVMETLGKQPYPFPFHMEPLDVEDRGILVEDHDEPLKGPGPERQVLC